jgi:predicted transcriptional regulator
MATENQVRKVARDCSLVFNALGDPNRQDILIMLEMEGPLNVLQITERLNLGSSDYLPPPKDSEQCWPTQIY